MSDYGKSIMGMGAATGAGMGWLVEKMGGLVRYKGEKISEPMEEVGRMLKERGLESSRMWMEEKMEAVGIDEAGLSPQARVAMQQELLGEAITSESKFNKLKLMAVGSVFGTALGMGSGRLLTAAFQRASMSAGKSATIGYSLGEAGVAAPASGAATEDEIMRMPLNELEESLEYQAAFEGLSGIEDPVERSMKARELVADSAANVAASINFISTFGLSMPFGKQLDKLVGGGGAKSATIGGRAAGTARGAATEGTQEFFQSGGEKVGENIAMIGAGFDRGVFEGALEEALGGAGSGAIMGGPFGYQLDPQAVTAEQEAALAEIERVQKEAEAAAAAEGGDMLDVALAGETAAAEFGQAIVEDLRTLEELDTILGTETDEEIVARGAETPEQAAEQAAEQETEQLTDQEVAAEIETELLREEAQKEAGEKYVAQNIEQLKKQKETEVTQTQREEELAAKKQAEEEEARYQLELQKGEGVKQIEEAGVDAKPAKTTALAEGLQKVKKQKAQKKAAGLEARRILEKAKNQPPLLEDKRPSQIVVDPSGAARPMSAAEVDSQIKRRWEAMEQMGLDLKDPETNIPVRINDVNLGIENPKGSTRTGTNPDGTTWTQTFRGVHYGNIEGVRGADNERLDVYVGEQSWSPIESRQKVWVVNQYKPNGTFDEHKVMLGFANKEEATTAFDDHNGGNMPRGEVVEMTMADFKKWAFDGKRKSKPLASPEVLTSATEADIELLRDRATGKGRKRPKVLYRRSNEEIDFTPGAQGPVEFEKTEPVNEELVGHIVRRVEGKAVAVITLREGPFGNLQIARAEVKSNLRGQGIGKQMILEAVRFANRQGKELVSDNTVSVAQLRAYESLRKSGDLVLEYSAPAKVQEALAEEDNDFSVAWYTPVINRMFIPSYTETIAYRKSEEMVQEVVDKDAVNNVIRLLMNFMPGIQTRVFTANTWRDLPAKYQERLSADGATDARGFIDHDTGEIYVILQNHPNNGAAVKTFMHEAVGHYGLRKVFGPKMDSLLDDIFKNADPSMRRYLDDLARPERYGLDYSVQADRRRGVEELIAHMAETAPKKTAFQQVVNFFRELFRNAGILSSWTENDIHSLLRDVRRELRVKPLEKIKITMEAEIEETGEVVQLEQTAAVALRRLDKRESVVQKLRECVA